MLFPCPDFVRRLTEYLQRYYAALDHTHPSSYILGEIRMFARSSLPSGWMMCDGSELTASQYPDLYAVIGEAYGSTDPGNYFRIPDLEAAFPICRSLDYGLDFIMGATGGERDHILSLDEMPTHHHELGRSIDLSFDVPVGSTHDVLLDRDNHVLNRYTGEAGGGLPHNNMPPYVAVAFAIYVGG